ncbi:MAG: hypothetical protein EXR68_04925 [Dehalococcoidia bacterium]|nr:hypothetical protein [Dehalococcoidia bacterium]
MSSRPPRTRRVCSDVGRRSRWYKRSALCPQAIVVSPDFAAYLDVSRRFHALLGEVTPIVESGGLDEAFAYLTGIGPDGLSGYAAAEALRARVRSELGTRCPRASQDHARPQRLILTTRSQMD